MHTGHFANESLCQWPVPQRMKSIRQRRMSVRQHRATFTLTRISIIPCSLPTAGPNKPRNMCTQNLTPYNLFLVLSSTRLTTYSLFFHPLPSQTKKYFGHCVPKWLACKRWQIDFIRWRNWSLAKWLVGETTGIQLYNKSSVEVYLNSFPSLRKVDRTLKVNIINPKTGNRYLHVELLDLWFQRSL